MAENKTENGEPKAVPPPFKQKAADLAKAKQQAYDEDRARLAEESKPRG